MTYLEIVNKVLIRLRENEVTSVQDSPYSKLIGEFVNVVKREVEDTYNWSALRTTIVATTVPEVYSYTLVGSTTRSKVFDVFNNTGDYALKYQTTTWFDKAFLTGNADNGEPQYWNFNGVSDNGDQIVDLFPIPDGAYDVRFNIYAPQVDLVEDTDVIKIPYQLIIEGVLARAISERGDDGGYTEQEGRYNRILSDYIAIESANRPDETIWYLV